MICVLCGGVGAARLLRALADVVPAGSTVGVVNTGDDTELHGLSISPDLDTITYTLAAAIDPERGWGLRDETWRAMEALGRYAAIRPEGSRCADVVQPRRHRPGHALLPDGSAARRRIADDRDGGGRRGLGARAAAAADVRRARVDVRDARRERR